MRFISTQGSVLHPVPCFGCHNGSSRLSRCVLRYALWHYLSISSVIEPGSQALLPSLEWSGPTVCPDRAQCDASLLNQSQREPPLSASIMFFTAFYCSWISSIKYSESAAGSSSTTTGRSVEPAMVSREFNSQSPPLVARSVLLRGLLWGTGLLVCLNKDDDALRGMLLLAVDACIATAPAAWCYARWMQWCLRSSQLPV